MTERRPGYCALGGGALVLSAPFSGRAPVRFHSKPPLNGADQQHPSANSDQSGAPSMRNSSVSCGLMGRPSSSPVGSRRPNQRP